MSGRPLWVRRETAERFNAAYYTTPETGNE
jgi:hypothetical protein